MMGRIIYFNHLKQYQEAKADFERSIELNPNNGMYYLNLSRCYYMMGDVLNANTNAQKAIALGIEIDPAYAGAIGLIN